MDNLKQFKSELNTGYVNDNYSFPTKAGFLFPNKYYVLNNGKGHTWTASRILQTIGIYNTN